MTESAGATATPYGSWPSPISAADVAKGHVLISYPIVIGDDVWWQEGRPDEGGRVTVVHCGPDGTRRTVLAAPWDARSRVHEYGGLSYLPVPHWRDPGSESAGTVSAGTLSAGMGAIVFANYADQRLYLMPQDQVADKAEGRGKGKAPLADRGPAPLTPEPAGHDGHAALRYADFTLSPDGSEIWCVQERHDDSKVTRAIVAVPLDGSAAASPEAIRELATGSDFFAFPTPSPDGSRLAWVCWNHPRMPWDGTELRVTTLSGDLPAKGRLVKGGMRESVMAPRWRNESSLYVVSDWPGWWNVYQVGLVGEPAQALFPAEEEFGEPLWQLGGRPFAVLGDGRLAVLHGIGGMRLGLLDPETAEMTDPDIGFQEFVSGLSADGNTIVGVAGGPTTPPSVIRIDAVTGQTTVLRRETEEVPDTAYLPVPRPVPYQRMAAAAPSAPVPTEVPPSDLTVTASVGVTYEIAP